MTSLTLSFIESSYPRELIKHLKNERYYKVVETSPGIYTVHGDIFPIQIIDSRKLSAEENLWLKGLSDDLNYSIFRKINAEIARQGNDTRITAYLYAITQANPVALKEAIKMGNKLTLKKVLEEAGWIAEWEEKGRNEGIEQTNVKWQNIVAGKDAEIARLREQLEKNNK